MPTYEYRCDACGHQFELFQSMTSPVKRKCPKCSKPRLQRLIGIGAGVIFKGGGFYETDYRSESYKKAAEAEKSAAAPASTEVKADNKAESKPETKAEAPAAKSESTATQPTAKVKPKSGRKANK